MENRMRLDWELAESIRDHLGKLNALLDALADADFVEIREESRAAYVTVIMDYLGSLEKLLEPLLIDDVHVPID